MGRPVVAAVAAGGVLGALARHGLTAAWPHPAGDFPWSTLVVNVSGCFLIGVLMTLIPQNPDAQRPVLRPFLGTGFLGGYTTFSASVADVLVTRPVPALAYLGATVIGALLAVWCGVLLTEALVRAR